MRVIVNAPATTSARYFEKALREASHSVLRVADVRDALWQAAHDAFDAIMILTDGANAASDAASDTAAGAVSAARRKTALAGPHAAGKSDVSDAADAADAAAILSAQHLVSALQPMAQARRPPIVVVLCQAASAAMRTALLRAGAHACFVAPFSFIEIHARLTALQRLMDKRSAPALAAFSEPALPDERALNLTVREHLFMECLQRANGKPVSREKLIDYAWPGDAEVSASAVNHLALRLRRKLVQAGAHIDMALVPRFGYCIRQTPVRNDSQRNSHVALPVNAARLAE